MNHNIIIKVDSKYAVDYESDFMESALNTTQLKSLICQQCAKLESLKISRQVEQEESTASRKKEWSS